MALIVKILQKYIFKYKCVIIFNFEDGFSFDSTGNVLTINNGSLKYSPGIAYQFTVETIYMSKNFMQIFIIEIDMNEEVPIANLK